LCRFVSIIAIVTALSRKRAMLAKLVRAGPSGERRSLASAALLFFRPFPGARLVTRFLELFVAFRSFLVAFTLIFLYGSQGSFSIALQRLLHRDAPPLDFLFGIGGVVLAEVVFYAPCGRRSPRSRCSTCGSSRRRRASAPTAGWSPRA